MKTYTYQHRINSRITWTLQNDTWQAFQEDGAAALQSLNAKRPADPIQVLHDCMSTPFLHYFSTTRSVSQTEHTFHTKWKLRHLARHQSGNMHGVIRAWSFWTQFKCKCRAQKHLAKQRRETRAHQLIQDVQDAADKHDQFLLYRVINQYCPKTKTPPIKLKHNGMLLTPEEAH